MVQPPILILLAALVALLPMAHPSFALGTAVTLEGRVTMINGNQLPGPRTPPLQADARRTVIAVSGQLAPLQPGQAFLPARSLRAPIIARTHSNARGRFRLVVPVSPQASKITPTVQRLTLLLVVPGGYYLNLFDDQGRFASLALPLSADHPPIVLRDDRGAIH